MKEIDIFNENRLSCRVPGFSFHWLKANFDQEVLKEELEVLTSKSFISSLRRTLKVVGRRNKAQIIPAPMVQQLPVASTSQAGQSLIRSQHHFTSSGGQAFP